MVMKRLTYIAYAFTELFAIYPYYTFYKYMAELMEKYSCMGKKTF